MPVSARAIHQTGLLLPFPKCVQQAPSVAAVGLQSSAGRATDCSDWTADAYGVMLKELQHPEYRCPPHHALYIYFRKWRGHRGQADDVPTLETLLLSTIGAFLVCSQSCC